MSQDRSDDRTDGGDDRAAPDFYLPGAPTPSFVSRLRKIFGAVFHTRGRTRGDVEDSDEPENR